MNTWLLIAILGTLISPNIGTGVVICFLASHAVSFALRLFERFQYRRELRKFHVEP